MTDEEEAKVRSQAEEEEAKLASNRFFFPSDDDKAALDSPSLESCLGTAPTQLDPDRRGVHAFAELRDRFHKFTGGLHQDQYTVKYPRNKTPVPVSTPSGRWFGQDAASTLQSPAPAGNVFTAGVLPRPPNYRPLMRDIPLAWDQTPKDYYIKPPTPPPSTRAPLAVATLGAHVPKDSMGVKSQLLIPILPRTSSGALRHDPTAPVMPVVAPSGLTASDNRQYVEGRRLVAQHWLDDDETARTRACCNWFVPSA